jgi:serine/threonine protein kinase
MEPGYLLSGRYRISDLVGRGSESSVYRAHDELLQREVAVKLFRNDADDLEQTRRHGEEIRILAGMSHHALVTLFDAGADLSDRNDPLTYLVMELVRGQDLRHRGAQGPLSTAHMAHIGYDLADGLSYIHHHGIVHRDVKPANILLVDYSNDDRRPRAKLTDFGVAVIARQGPVPDEGGTSGTPAYLSPEQAAGEVVGPASDVYSLGLVLLEGLTGKMAYPGAPIQSAVARLLHDPQIPEELAPMWVALLSSMLARHPAQRPAAREVSLALRQEVINSAARHRKDGAPAGGDEEGRLRAVHPARRRLRPDRGTRGTDVLRAGGHCQCGGP